MLVSRLLAGHHGDNKVRTIARQWLTVRWNNASRLELVSHLGPLLWRYPTWPGGGEPLEHGSECWIEPCTQGAACQVDLRDVDPFDRGCICWQNIVQSS